ncbi:glutathione peroxidase [uncultured Microbacterium sp.]|uniref:glutathione peroxidase n=1 Tax=uncultured Microbacterium sp. TaxID=191216 RepID=UPI0025DC5D8B|nr:glutathione peroxidase [uncultured Microbacterium sp.]
MSETPVRQIPFSDAEGAVRTLDDYGTGPVLVVNVASKCGLTPQYAQLEELQRRFGDRGLTVVGFPCNQFFGQEPGSMEQILDFCSTTYGISFPINEKVKVNGRNAAELYKSLKQTEDGHGKSGRVEWNFEKFLVAPDGSVRRFRPRQVPEDPEIVSAIEAALG